MSSPASTPTEDTPKPGESATFKQDDKQLMRLASLVGTDAKTPELKLARYVDSLISAAQIQLVSELIETTKKAIPDYSKLDVSNQKMLEGYGMAANEIITALEHKKQELERGK